MNKIDSLQQLCLKHRLAQSELTNDDRQTLIDALFEQDWLPGLTIKQPNAKPLLWVNAMVKVAGGLPVGLTRCFVDQTTFCKRLVQDLTEFTQQHKCTRFSIIACNDYEKDWDFPSGESEAITWPSFVCNWICITGETYHRKLFEGLQITPITTWQGQAAIDFISNTIIDRLFNKGRAYARILFDTQESKSSDEDWVSTSSIIYRMK